MNTDILVPLSPGELIDKITILHIKSQRIDDPQKVANVRIELELLEATWRACVPADADIDAEYTALRDINERLWDIEDDIREKERQGSFDQEFIDLARAVYVTNDERSAVKRRINVTLGSRIVEEKSYAKY